MIHLGHNSGRIAVIAAHTLDPTMVSGIFDIKIGVLGAGVLATR